MSRKHRKSKNSTRGRPINVPRATESGSGPTPVGHTRGVLEEVATEFSTLNTTLRYDSSYPSSSVSESDSSDSEDSPFRTCEPRGDNRHEWSLECTIRCRRGSNHQHRRECDALRKAMRKDESCSVLLSSTSREPQHASNRADLHLSTDLFSEGGEGEVEEPNTTLGNESIIGHLGMRGATADLAPRHHQLQAKYQENWSRVVLGATSGIMFVLVVALCYTLYGLIHPYKLSIFTGVLFSIVLHPCSRVQSSLQMEACLRRMQATQRRWAAHGRVFGVVGSWLSLPHFASFMVMRLVFFLGLNKIEWTPLLVIAWELMEEKPQHSPESVCCSPAAQHRSGDGTAKTAAAERPPLVPRTTAPTQARAEAEKAAVGEKAHPRDRPYPAPRRCRMVATVRGRWCLRVLVSAIVACLAHTLLGLQYFLLMHAGLFVLFLLMVPFCREDTFIRIAGWLWGAALAMFFVCGLAYNLAKDILAIREAVRRTTSAVVHSTLETGLNHSRLFTANGSEADGSTPSPATLLGGSGGNSSVVMSGLFDQQLVHTFVVAKLHKLVLRELSDVFNQTNMTEMAAEMLGMFAPSGADTGVSGGGGGSRGAEGSVLGGSTLAAQLLPQWIYSNIFSGNAMQSIIIDGSHSATAQGTVSSADLLGLAKVLSYRLYPYIEYAIRMLVHLSANLMNLFDSIYAIMLFGVMFRYLTKLDHTVLYYIIAKTLNAIDPELGSHHARIIERDITVSFVTLLQSFWHLAWFHFSITFCAFRLWSLPTPFLAGVVSVVLSIFPLVPKWVGPCSIALGYSFTQAAADSGILGALPNLRIQTLIVAVVLEYSDEWLLCVSRGLRGNFVSDVDVDSELEQLQSFVVGTAVVLGFVAWGTRGIVLGPLAVIVAKVVFDNWDIVFTTPARQRRGRRRVRRRGRD